jgi:hydroxymethylglutaryl-CoA reductase (NADPH)
MYVPNTLLRRLYTFGSLKNTDDGVEFCLKNRLSDARVTGLRGLVIDGRRIPPESVRLTTGNGSGSVQVDTLDELHPLEFPLARTMTFRVPQLRLPDGKHELEISFSSRPFGELRFQVSDLIVPAERVENAIPRDAENDYAQQVIEQRQRYVEAFAGRELKHIGRFAFDPALCRGNCEHLTGVAQVPLGFAGPLLVDGEHANGRFLVPLATTEGTLVASYNRGMQVMNLCGGVKCTVSDDAMQRAPVFVFDDARGAREFARWIVANFAQIAAAAEATSSVAKLRFIEPYLSNNLAFLRFNYSTGDAAGQNMVSKATYAACCRIVESNATIRKFYLEGNVATDKKPSHLNVLHTRGKRVTAEAVLKNEVLLRRLHVDAEALVDHYQVANIGSMLAGTNNNGLHSANALAALFIATGQDVANVAESCAATILATLTAEGDLYLSITLPSLIVATHGGGTGLPTQRECLEIMGCYGAGKVNKLAEIVAATVLAGELSLAAAISSLDWVTSHEEMGRHR